MPQSEVNHKCEEIKSLLNQPNTFLCLLRPLSALITQIQTNQKKQKLRDAIIQCYTGNGKSCGNVLQVGLAALFGQESQRQKKKTEPEGGISCLAGGVSECGLFLSAPRVS